MNVCILMGSPRKNGNTAALLSPFCKELDRLGCNHETIRLYEKRIASCTACRACQRDWSGFNCRIQDDAKDLAHRILNCDLLVLATPIYSWFCTPPMKALLDRLVYGMNKYYGDTKGPALWKGKKVALITTCGYPLEKGADLWETGMRRFCKHSQLSYIGMLAEHDEGYDTVFMNKEKEQHSIEFAQKIYQELESLKKDGLDTKRVAHGWLSC